MPKINDKPSTNGRPSLLQKHLDDRKHMRSKMSQILDKLERVYSSGDGWMACCPAHDDGTPSLSVGLGSDGRVLLNCFGGCDFEEIVDALGMRARDFAPGGHARSNGRGKKSLSKSLKRLTAYDNEKEMLKATIRESHHMEEEGCDPIPFPIEVYPKALQQFVTSSAEALSAPVDYIAAPVLAVVGSFIGHKRGIEIKRGWIEFPCIYGVLAGHTGSKKSPGLELAMKPAQVRDDNLEKEFRNQKRKYELRKRKAQKTQKPFSEAPPQPQQHICTDTTVEALADVLTTNLRGVLVYRDEMTAWVSSLNQYKGGKGSDRQFWLSAWSSQNYTVNRKGKDPLRILAPFVCVIGNIPPDMLGELADRRGREDGFIDRLLFAYPDPVQVKWTDKHPDKVDEYVDACLLIGELSEATLTFTESATTAFALWYNEHNSHIDGPRGSWAKMDGYCARLALILHHLRFAYGDITNPDDAIDSDTVHDAIKLIDYFKNGARRALGRMKATTQERTLARLLSFIRNSPDYTVRPRSLIAAQIAPNADEAKKMLTDVAQMGLGEIQGGRRKDEFKFVGRNDLESVVGE